MPELVGRTTRGLFRDLTTGSTVGQIETAFRDEGFAPNPECVYDDSSVRRSKTQSYLESITWTDPGHIRRFLNVAERLLGGWPAESLQQFHSSLRREGFQVDEGTGQSRRPARSCRSTRSRSCGIRRRSRRASSGSAAPSATTRRWRSAAPRS